MKKILFVSLLSNLTLITFSQNATNDRLRIADEMGKSMRVELLDKWYPQSLDTVYGGFLSSFTFDFKPTPNQDKMIVTQARHVWSNSKASQWYPDVRYFKSDAHHGFLFLRDVMWDKKLGGFYTLVDRQGNVKNGDSIKTAYGNAFAIFALAAYFKASGDTSALTLARKAFTWLEKGNKNT